MPLAYHDPHHRTRLASHVRVPPAGRLEVIVTGQGGQTKAKLRTRCFDTGPDGDPNPSMVLADLIDVKAEASAIHTVPASLLKPLFAPVADATLASLEKTAPDFTVTFTEDKQSFYINGKRYGPEDTPMTRVRVGAYQH